MNETTTDEVYRRPLYVFILEMEYYAHRSARSPGATAALRVLGGGRFVCGGVGTQLDLCSLLQRSWIRRDKSRPSAPCWEGRGTASPSPRPPPPSAQASP